MESPGYTVGQLPFSEAEDNDDEIFHRSSRPPKYRRQDRRTRHARRTTAAPVSSRRRRRRSPSPLSSASTSPVRERRRHRRYDDESRKKRLSVSSSTLENTPARLPWIIRLFIPSFTTQLTVMFVSLAVVAFSALYYQLRGDVGLIVRTVFNLVGNVADSVQVPVTAFVNGTSTAVSIVWCGSVGWGCIGTREAAMIFKTHRFHELPTTPPAEEDQKTQLANLDVSLGHNFFDCLEDLGKIRSQKTPAAHLLTLAPKIYQWNRFLEHPDELYDSLTSLADLRREVLLNSNAARVVGRNSIELLYTESQRTDVLSKNRIPQPELMAHINSVLTSTNQQLASSANHMTRTSDGLKSTEELTRKISGQIHQEIARLRRLNTEEKSHWGFKAKELLVPGVVDEIKDREDAAGFLKEVANVIDSGVIVSLTSSLSLQQCAINTKHLNEALERTFALSNAKFDLSTRIRHISNGINPLKNRLLEYDEASSAKKTTISKKT